MGTHHDNPPCEMCESANTWSSFESRGGDYEVECYDCGYAFNESPKTDKRERYFQTTRHCSECNSGINFFTDISSEGYSMDCENCGYTEIRSAIELFLSVQPEERWNDMFTDMDYWQPCDNKCGDYWYDANTDASTCCFQCSQQLKQDAIWQDWN